VHEILAEFRPKSKAQLSFTEQKFINEDRRPEWHCYLELNAGGKTVSEKCELLEQARRAFLQVLRAANRSKASSGKKCLRNAKNRRNPLEKLGT
jgi:hypothetical protein